jgi:hypothetical protein
MRKPPLNLSFSLSLIFHDEAQSEVAFSYDQSHWVVITDPLPVRSIDFIWLIVGG